MKGNKNTYATIGYIVNSVCIDLGEGKQRGEQYLKWAIDEANRFHFDHAKEVKTVDVTLTTWKAIQLPIDCVDWIKIGVQFDNRLLAFVNKRSPTMNDNLAIHHQVNTNGFPINNTDPVYDGSAYNYPFINYCGDYYRGKGHFYNGSGQLFGLAVKDNGFGYFTENRNGDRRELQLRTTVQSNTPCVLEYLSDGWNPSEETLIHPYAVERIEAGIHYRRLKHDNKPGVDLAWRDYLLACDRLTDRQWNYTVEDILEAMNQGYVLTANV
jgi:hypothetical protein